MQNRNLYKFYSGLLGHQHPRAWANSVPAPSSATFQDLEAAHDYIQWWFPTLEQSSAQPDQPYLRRSDVASFRNDAAAQQVLRQRFHLMLAFYDLEVQSHSPLKIVPSATAAANWRITAGDHNINRMTRMLNSLVTLGLWKEAVAFYQCIVPLAQKHFSPSEFSLIHDRYWKPALTWNAMAAEQTIILQALSASPTPPAAKSSVTVFSPLTPAESVISPVVQQASNTIAKQMVAKNECQTLPTIRPGNLANTFKVAFENKNEANAFYQALTQAGYLVTYHNQSGRERYPMNENGKVLSNIVRFELRPGEVTPQDAVHYLKNTLGLPQADQLFANIMGDDALKAAPVSRRS